MHRESGAGRDRDMRRYYFLVSVTAGESFGKTWFVVSSLALFVSSLVDTPSLSADGTHNMTASVESVSKQTMACGIAVSYHAPHFSLLLLFCCCCANSFTNALLIRPIHGAFSCFATTSALWHFGREYNQR